MQLKEDDGKTLIFLHHRRISTKFNSLFHRNQGVESDTLWRGTKYSDRLLHAIIWQ